MYKQLKERMNEHLQEVYQSNDSSLPVFGGRESKEEDFEVTFKDNEPVNKKALLIERIKEAKRQASNTPDMKRTQKANFESASEEPENEKKDIVVRNVQKCIFESEKPLIKIKKSPSKPSKPTNPTSSNKKSPLRSSSSFNTPTSNSSSTRKSKIRTPGHFSASSRAKSRPQPPANLSIMEVKRSRDLYQSPSGAKLSRHSSVHSNSSQASKNSKNSKKSWRSGRSARDRDNELDHKMAELKSMINNLEQGDDLEEDIEQLATDNIMHRWASGGEVPAQTQNDFSSFGESTQNDAGHTSQFVYTGEKDVFLEKSSDVDVAKKLDNHTLTILYRNLEKMNTASASSYSRLASSYEQILESHTPFWEEGQPLDKNDPAVKGAKPFRNFNRDILQECTNLAAEYGDKKRRLSGLVTKLKEKMAAVRLVYEELESKKGLIPGNLERELDLCLATQDIAVETLEKSHEAQNRF